jgi:hypothetical protein
MAGHRLPHHSSGIARRFSQYSTKRHKIAEEPDRPTIRNFAKVLIPAWQAVEKASKTPFWRRAVALKIRQPAVEKQVAAPLSPTQVALKIHL